MPVQHSVDTRRRRVVAHVSGKLTLDEIIAAVDAAVNDPDFEPGFDVYSDHREIEEVIDTQQVRGLTAHLQSLAPRLAGARWAVVTRTRASYGMIRMISAYAEQVPMEVRAFATRAEAEAWLDSPRA